MGDTVVGPPLIAQVLDRWSMSQEQRHNPEDYVRGNWSLQPIRHVMTTLRTCIPFRSSTCTPGSFDVLWKARQPNSRRNYLAPRFTQRSNCGPVSVTSRSSLWLNSIGSHRAGYPGRDPHRRDPDPRGGRRRDRRAHRFARSRRGQGTASGRHPDGARSGYGDRSCVHASRRGRPAGRAGEWELFEASTKS